jgi:hypothetical protein
MIGREYSVRSSRPFVSQNLRKRMISTIIKRWISIMKCNRVMRKQWNIPSQLSSISSGRIVVVVCPIDVTDMRGATTENKGNNVMKIVVIANVGVQPPPNPKV